MRYSISNGKTFSEELYWKQHSVIIKRAVCIETIKINNKIKRLKLFIIWLKKHL